MRLRHLALALLLCPALAHADEFNGTPELTPDDRAAIEADRDAAHKAVDEKLQGDDSAGARRERQKAYQQADEEVLQKRGISDRDYLRQSSHDAPSTQKEIREKKKAIEEKRKADAEAAKQAPAEGTSAEPEVVKGFGEGKPLDLSAETSPKKAPAVDADGNPLPTVEKATGDDAAAPAEAPPAPSRKGGRHRKSRGE